MRLFAALRGALLRAGGRIQIGEMVEHIETDGRRVTAVVSAAAAVIVFAGACKKEGGAPAAGPGQRSRVQFPVDAITVQVRSLVYSVTAVDKAVASKTPGTRLNLDQMTYRVSPVAEFTQIFNDTWRWYRDFFYVGNMHGFDWAAIGKRYEAIMLKTKVTKIEATKAVLAGARDKAAVTEHKSSPVVHQNQFLAKAVTLVGFGSLEPTPHITAAAEQSANLAMAVAGTGLPAFCLFIAGLYRRKEDHQADIAPPVTVTKTDTRPSVLKTQTIAQLRSLAA